MRALRGLRRHAGLTAAVLALAAVIVGTAVAEVSPNSVTTTSTTLYWSGQGAPVTEECGTAADPGAGGYQNGASASDYMMWIFSTDGGSVSPPAPTLTINGTTYNHAYKPAGQDHSFGWPGAWQIVTPYIDPSTITPADKNIQNSTGSAFANFTVNTTGNGSWVLTISHGCSGGSTPPAANLTVSKDANGSYDTTDTWDITKTVDTPTVYSAGGGESNAANYTVTVTNTGSNVGIVQVSGTISVSNTNVVAVTLSSISDQLVDSSNNAVAGASCSVDTSSGTTVPANSVGTFDYTCTLDSLPSHPVFNVVTVNWPTTPVPGFEDLLAGSATFTAPDPTTTPSGIDFVQANEFDKCVTVSDNSPSWPGDYTVCAGDPALPVVTKYSETFTDPAGTCTKHTNTATVGETTDDVTPPALPAELGRDSADVTDCQGADLTVTKTATPSFTRTYKWTIDKKVDKTLVEQIGGNATFNYTVKVSQTGFTDSAWQVTGTITVHNPNDWEAITLTGVTDAIDNGGVCTVSGNTTQTIAAGGDSTGLSYTCTYGSAPSPLSGTNTATATWDKAAAHTTDGTADGTAGADFTNLAPTTLVNQTVTPTDAFNGGSGVNLCTLDASQPCTLTATDSTPFTSATYKYPRTVPVPAKNCLKYPNTASVLDQSSSQTVEVCGPALTGALTMGFWQNKNGQAIITGQAKTGVCPSTTWLRLYAPFQDLAATSTCAQVGTYVTNIIKAANASGAAMNAMLKAQMLATALDVYFSDPALGGNAIKAPAPIGGVSIDLTKICKMIDSSSGTATCNGTYENVSSAFGGATSLTVAQMLAYAASQSNSGGVTWYGQVKATQGLAKDAFDAINNGVVFAP